MQDRTNSASRRSALDSQASGARSLAPPSLIMHVATSLQKTVADNNLSSYLQVYLSMEQYIYIIITDTVALVYPIV